MPETGDQLRIFIVLAVVLLMLIAVTVMVIIDHKIKIPGYFQHDPFSLSGLKLRHLLASFTILSILLLIITSLALALSVTVAEHFGVFSNRSAPTILEDLQEQRRMERKRQFHNMPAVNPANQGNKPVCFYCHGDFPHARNEKVRVLLNMHTQFLGCLTCHNNPRLINQDKLHFAWLNYSGIPVSGPRYGTDMDPQTGFPLQTDDYYSKIVAYLDTGSERQLLEIPETNPRAEKFLRIKDKLTVVESQSIKRTLHKNVTRRARLCSRCHTTENESYLPLRELGFSARRIAALTSPKLVELARDYSETIIVSPYRQ